MDILDLVKKYNSNFQEIIEAPISTEEKEVVGWHSQVHLKDGMPLSGGTHSDRLQARRIAMAEAIERGVFFKLAGDPEQRQRFLIDEVPTSSGFAAGFNNTLCRRRAICEGVERWAWSQWIDCKKAQNEVFPESERLSRLAQQLLEPFERIQYYSRPLLAQINEEVYKLNFNVVLAFRDKGVFLGSRVTSKNEDQWEHCAVEAYRNLKNFEHMKSGELSIDAMDWLTRRIYCFGLNAEVGMKAISQATGDNWPTAKIRLLKNTDVEKGVFVWRCLCHNFIPWNEGGDDRFIY